MEPMKKIVPFARPERKLATIAQPAPAVPPPNVCATCKNCRFVRVGWDAEAYKTIIAPCPTCCPSARSRAVSLKQAELIGRVFGGSQVPSEMHDWTFDTYPRAGDRKAHATVRTFVEQQLSNPGGQRGLYMGGDVGVGKTGCAVSLLHMVEDAGQTCLFFNEIDLSKRLKGTMNARSVETENDILSIVTTVAWLVLDDVGVIKPTDYVIETYYHIIEQRRTKGLHTVLTSNLSTADLEKYWRGKDGTEFHQSKRVVDRLRDYCCGVTFSGRNLRKGQV